MGVKSTFRERGERKATQRGDEGKNSEVPGAGRVCLLPGASKQAQQEGRGQQAGGQLPAEERPRRQSSGVR